MLCDNLGEVLSEDAGLLVTEHGPEVLDQWVWEEQEPFTDTILEVNVEVVLLDALSVLAQLVLHVLGELAQEGDLRRLDHNIERHLDSFSLKQVVGHS